MPISLRRSGVLVCAHGIPSRLVPALKKRMEYLHKSMDPDGRGGMRMSSELKQLHWEQEDGGLVFPVGFVPMVYRLLEKVGERIESYERVDREGKLEYDLSLVDVKSWRPEQRQMIKAFVVNDGGLLVSPTGSGKTFGLGEICAMYPTALIVCCAPTVAAVQTMHRYLVDRLGRKQVGQVGGGKHHSSRVTVSTFDSLTKVDRFDHIDILIVDEVHRAPAAKYMSAISAMSSPFKRFGFTATVSGRFDDAEMQNEAYLGPVLVDNNYQTSVKAGSVVPLHVIFKENPHGPSDAWLRNRTRQVDKDRKGVWRNEGRNTLIAKDVREMIEARGDPQTLIIVDKVEHAFALKEELPDFTVVSGPMDGKRVNKLRRSKLTIKPEDICTDKRRVYYQRQFEQGKLRRVIATAVWAAAVSANDCSLLVYAAGNSNVIMFRQACGRVSRTSDGKSHGTVLAYFDTFANSFRNRSLKLIKAAKADGHEISRIAYCRGEQ